MKLTKEKLKKLIKDVILENREKSMILTEGDKKSKKKFNLPLYEEE